MFGTGLILNEHMSIKQNVLGIIMLTLSLPFVVRDFRRMWTK